MKTLNFTLGSFNVRCAVAVLGLSAWNDCEAQIQQAWVARYNNAIANGTNQAVKMALDPSGYIYVTGFSQNSNANLGYVTVKYAPNGNQQWASRYDSTNYPLSTPFALGLDSSNNVIITGSALTIKYDTNGNQLWTAPNSGTALAVDTNGNIGVTGFGTNFNTVKLSPSGSNLWQETFPSSCGAATGQAILADTNGNIYVAGSYPFGCAEDNIVYELLIIKYGLNGSQVWAGNATIGNGIVQVEGVALDGMGNVYVAGNCGVAGPYSIFRYTSNGSLTWAMNPGQSGSSSAHSLGCGLNGYTVIVGQVPYKYTGAFSYYYGIFGVNIDGDAVWTNYFPEPPSGSSVANAVTMDLANNSYVTGYSSGSNSGTDIVTIEYGPNGNQIWLQRYHGPGSGNDAGNAIAVDNNGNVYVTGYEATAAGGTEIVTIKYSPLTLKRQANNSFLLQAQGYPGESFDIQASANLLNWLDLGTVIADTNGLMQYADTNASNFPSRFYITSPQ